MNWTLVLSLLRHELKMVYRDHRTVVLSVVLPIIMMPILVFSLQAVQRQKLQTQGEQVYVYVLAEDDEQQLQQLQAFLEVAGRLSEEPLRLREAHPDSAVEALDAGEVDLVLDLLLAEEAQQLEPAEPSATEKGLGPSPSRERRLEGVPAFRIRFLAGRNRSMQARQMLTGALAKVLDQHREHLLGEAGLPVADARMFEMEFQNVAGDVRQTGAMIGPYLTILLVLLLLGGGSVAALDILAGERERGTLETLLISAAGRREILAAKQLAILCVALLIAGIQVVNVAIYLGLDLIDLPENFAFHLPAEAILALAVLVIPLGGVIAAVLLAVSGRAESYKEAQQLYFPAFVVCCALSLAGGLPQVTLRSAMVAVPIANVSVGVREIFVGVYDWPFLLLAAAVTSLAGLVLVRDTADRLSGEELFAGGEEDEWSPRARFSLQVWRWFAVMAALLVVIPPNVRVLNGLVGQVLFNQLAVFLALSLLMRYLYGLSGREMFALRSVRAPVWLAIVLLVPATHLLATGLVQFADLFIPVPTEMMEEMSRMLVPEGISTWQLIVLLAILPGVCEELAFRGALLYGLHRRLRPASLVLAVGLVFGLFHFSLFRIAPTAFTGAVLTGVALLTGSIYPGIVAHILNNTLAVVAYRAQFSFTDLEWPAYLVAVLMAGLAFYILYRVRTPYPGLRTRRPPRGRQL